MKESELVQLRVLLMRYKERYESNTMAGKAIDGLVYAISTRIKRRTEKEGT